MGHQDAIKRIRHKEVYVRSKQVYGRDLSEDRAISLLGPNWVHVCVREINNIVVNQDISQCDKTSLGI